MDAAHFPKSWSIDQILDDLNQQGFSLIDHAYDASYIKQLMAECRSNLAYFRDAAIQNGVVSNIRSDRILWLNENLSISHQHVQNLLALGQIFNRVFYLGIKEVEAHFSCYEAGEFYALHRDNPKGKNSRMISAVYYLHDQWQEDWGGELRLQDKHEVWHTIRPEPNRLALFQSDILHEVLEAKHQRLSITAWLRSDTAVL